MRKFIVLIAVLLPLSTLAATTVSCPTNGHFVDIGSSVAEVTKVCGSPTSTKNSTRTVNVTEELTYYKPAANAMNSRMTLLFKRGRLANITLVLPISNCDPATQPNQLCSSETNPNWTNACGQTVGLDGDIEVIKSICGTPDTDKVLETATTNVTELSYKGVEQNKLVFEDGKLVDADNN